MVIYGSGSIVSALTQKGPIDDYRIFSFCNVKTSPFIFSRFHELPARNGKLCLAHQRLKQGQRRARLHIFGAVCRRPSNRQGRERSGYTLMKRRACTEKGGRTQEI
jgi:hypothetical protein